MSSLLARHFISRCLLWRFVVLGYSVYQLARMVNLLCLGVLSDATVLAKSEAGVEVAYVEFRVASGERLVAGEGFDPFCFCDLAPSAVRGTGCCGWGYR